MQSSSYHTESLNHYSFLVTGGAGFIGSHLVEYLLKHQAKEVRVLDNLSNGLQSNIDLFSLQPNYKFVKGDITNLSDCEKALEEVDYVLHQAALGSVPRSIENPQATHEANVTGTLNMLHASVKANVKGFVYASSSSVYGDNSDLPKKEGIIGTPLSPYAASKRACEGYAQSFWKAYQLPTIGLRYFNVFGPRQNPHSAYAAVIPLFAKALLNEEALTIYGDGEQARDFTFVENVVQANIRACFVHKESFGEVFNIGNQHNTTVNQLANTMSNFTGNSIHPRYAPSRKGDVRFSLADISKAKKLLNYIPETTFNEGIKRTFEWYKYHLI